MASKIHMPNCVQHFDSIYESENGVVPFGPVTFGTCLFYKRETAAHGSGSKYNGGGMLLNHKNPVFFGIWRVK